VPALRAARTIQMVSGTKQKLDCIRVLRLEANTTPIFRQKAKANREGRKSMQGTQLRNSYETRREADGAWHISF
jgi:hypothetical protein